MEIKLLSCPLCLKPHFEGVDALRMSLIAVATSQISCPICNEILLGLDKLTIHLFSHITKDIAENNMLKLSNGINNIASSENKIESIIIESTPNIVEKMHNNNNNNNNMLDQDGVNEEKIPKVEEKVSKMADVETRHIRCDICNFSFSDENILDIHQKLLHQTKVDKKTGVYNYHCHLCSKKFNIKVSLMVHLRVAHYGFGLVNNGQTNSQTENNIKPANYNYGNTEVAQDCEEQNVAEQFAVLPKARDNKHWACDVCLKLFTTKYFLKKHKRLHTGEMPYFCSQCNKFFTFQQSYHKHMLYHSSEKPHVCNECGRSFKELSTLHNHERIHSGERPFACETCGKCFRQRVSFLVHRRIHTGVMPYKCTACDKSFRYKVSQKSHKCTANPPGLVIRETNLLEKLIQKSVNKNLFQSIEKKDAEIVRFAECRLQQEIETNTCFNTESKAVELQIKEEKQRKQTARPNIRNDSDLLEVRSALCAQSLSKNTLVVTPPENYVFALNNYTSDQETIVCSENKGIFKKDININENIGTNQDKYPSQYLNTSANPDFFSLVLSPTLPEVELLSLSNAPIESAKNALETINEESFKKLLYGSSD